MWYWALPSGAITLVCMSLPMYVGGGFNFLSTGNLWARKFEADSRDYYLYMRDRRISGSEYKMRGLENLGKPLDTSAHHRNDIVQPFLK